MTLASPFVATVFLLSIMAPQAAATEDGPQPPDLVAGVAQPDGTVLLMWTPSDSPGVTGYRVYRTGVMDGLVGATSDTNFIDNVPAPPVTIVVLEYTVTALDGDTEGPASAPARVILLQPTTTPDCIVIDETTMPPGIGVDPDCIPPPP